VLNVFSGRQPVSEKIKTWAMQKSCVFFLRGCCIPFMGRVSFALAKRVSGCCLATVSLGFGLSQTSFRVHDEPNPVSGKDGLRAALTLPRQGAAVMECNARTCGIGPMIRAGDRGNPGER
jgi:hypothetical protein